ncbi:MAG: response regulator [Gammaproteobacteria bacterium]|nr:response regulator [Gammaproteobacteria bacterium]
MERVLLLVDDEDNIVRALVRLLRREGYTILTANSGKEGLALLAENEVGVILSDQRMPEMNGTEFLSRVKELYPDTVRMVLSGYTDLNSVTEAINQGSIYKFLTKPWDDDHLKENIHQAFQHLELIKENIRLTEELKSANALLANDNRELSKDVEEKGESLELHSRALDVAQEVLEKLPVAVLGIGDDSVIAVANRKAQEMIGVSTFLLGNDAPDALPAELIELYQTVDDESGLLMSEVELEAGKPLTVYCSRMGDDSTSSGSILVLMEKRISP